MVVNSNRPVAFVEDETLLDDVLKLAAAAGCELERVPDVASARLRWSRAPMVVLDAAGAKSCADAGLSRRDMVVLVSSDPPPADLFERGVQVGAERVLGLPGAEPWLIDALADAAEGPPSKTGKVLAVVGGRGGAGASVFAAAVGVAALRAGHNALLVDCDPMSGGLDLVLGAETEEGLRWPDMSLRGGRVAASALHNALPGRTRGDARLTFLSGARQGVGPAPDAVAAIVEAGRRSGETVVCDVARELGPAACAALDRADLTVIVVPSEVRACVSAKLLAARLTERGVVARLVVRGPSPGDLRAADVAEAVDLPLLVTMRPEPQLAESLERGEFHPRPRGPLSSAARATLAELATMPSRGQPGPDQRAVS